MITLLSIIILSFNTKKLTIKCLESIIRQHRKELENGVFEVIVVDNNSSDNTVSAIQQFKNKTINKIKIIENKKNYGFAKGNNIGAKKAQGKYLMILNSDTKVLDKGLLGMVDFLDKNKEMGILGARLVNSDGTKQSSVGTFYTIPALLVMLFGGERFGLLRKSPLKICQVDWVSGGAMMVRKVLFDKLNGFDEHFFMYVEDMELCWRSKKLGVLTYFYPKVTIMHKERASSNRSFAIVSIYKGLLYFYKKHTNHIAYLLVKLLLITKACIAIIIGWLTSDSYLKSTYRKALSLSIEE